MSLHIKSNNLAVNVIQWAGQKKNLLSKDGLVPGKSPAY